MCFLAVKFLIFNIILGNDDSALLQAKATIILGNCSKKKQVCWPVDLCVNMHLYVCFVHLLTSGFRFGFRSTRLHN